MISLKRGHKKKKSLPGGSSKMRFNICKNSSDSVKSYATYITVKVRIVFF